MKQTIISFAFAALLVLPAAPIYAQSATPADTQVAYQAVLHQLIVLLQQEIEELQQQLAAQGGTVATSTTAAAQAAIGALPDQTPQATAQTPSAPVVAPQLSCSLTVGSEANATVYNTHYMGSGAITPFTPGAWLQIPNGQFPLTWSFDSGATGVLTSDNGDNITLGSNVGTRTVNSRGTTNYTLTVSEDGAQPATCSVTATHQQ